MTQLEDEATEARNAAAERSEKLDQREADMGGKFADLEAEIVKLNRQLDAATELVSKVEDERDEAKADAVALQARLQVEEQRRQVAETERSGALMRGTAVLVNKNHWLEQAATLRKRIERVDDMVSNQLLYCDQVLGVLRGKGEDIERETHGNAESV